MAGNNKQTNFQFCTLVWLVTLCCGFSCKGYIRNPFPIVFIWHPAVLIIECRFLYKRHWCLYYVEGRFQWFDYGPKWNRQVYGSYDPPDYDLSQITAPVSLHYSTNDFLSYEKVRSCVLFTFLNQLKSFVVKQNLDQVMFLYNITA